MACIVGNFDGYPLIESQFCADIVQARKHKKKRINKKWMKRYGTRRVPWKKYILFDGRIYGHPTMIAKLIAASSFQQPAEDQQHKHFPNGDCT